MKKLYSTPNMNVVAIYSQDIITGSILFEEEHAQSIDNFMQDKSAWN